MLKISAQLDLPLDVVTEAIGIVATRGAGKSFTSAVVLEEAHAAHVPFVVIDPNGVYWGPPFVVVTISIHTDDPQQIADVEKAAKANGLKLQPIPERTSQFPRPRMSEIGRAHETLPLRGGEIT